MRLEGLLDEDFHDGGDWTVVTAGSMGNDLSGADPSQSRKGTKPCEGRFQPDLNKA